MPDIRKLKSNTPIPFTRLDYTLSLQITLVSNSVHSADFIPFDCFWLLKVLHMYIFVPTVFYF